MTKQRSDNLDVVRGLAALAVVISHLRAFVLVPYERCVAPGFFLKLVYFISGFGHEAVIIFFVLSGYLISGAIASRADNWSWLEYAINRLSRLWVVLMPCLLATGLLNAVGLRFTDTGYYNGDLITALHSGPSSFGVALDGATLVGNIFFLQTLTVPCYGDNGPLWSLANEFWYYALFPLVFFAIKGRGLPHRAICAITSVGIIYFMPMSMLVGFLIWCLGFAIVLLNRLEVVRTIAAGTTFLGGAGATLAVVLVGIRAGWISSDSAGWAVGISFAAVLLALSNRGTSESGPALTPFSWIGRFSYTLYLTHFPFVALLTGLTLSHRQLAAGPHAVLAFSGILFATIVYAWLLYRVFEIRTGKVKSTLVQWVGLPLPKAEVRTAI